MKKIIALVLLLASYIAVFAFVDRHNKTINAKKNDETYWDYKSKLAESINSAVDVMFREDLENRFATNWEFTQEYHKRLQRFENIYYAF